MADDNLIKQTCKELGLTYKQLSELIGLSEGRVKQLAIGEVGEQVEKALNLLLENHTLKNKIKEHEELQKLLKKFIS